MFSTHLDDAQRERLAFLIEELGEALHMAGKTLCHGFDSSHLDYGNISNRLNLIKELGHVRAAIDLLTANDLNAGLMDDYRVEKLSSVRLNARQFFHFQDGSKVE